VLPEKCLCADAIECLARWATVAFYRAKDTIYNA
jgi:hypothetical protein